MPRTAYPRLVAGALIVGVLGTLSCSAGKMPTVPSIDPPDPYPNQGAGMTKISERTFDAVLEDGWQDAFSLPATASRVVERLASPKSSGGYVTVTYRTGFQAGTEPINNYKVIDASVGTLYVSFWLKFSPLWEGHPNSGVNKILHIFIAGTNRVFLDANGRGTTAALQPRVALQQIASDGGFRNLLPNLVPTITLSRGIWYRWEFLLKANTEGLANGSATWWIDGVKVGEYNNIGFVRADQVHTWRSVNWAPTWGGSGGTVATDQSMSFDHLYISGKP